MIQMECCGPKFELSVPEFNSVLNLQFAAYYLWAIVAYACIPCPKIEFTDKFALIGPEYHVKVKHV